MTAIQPTMERCRIDLRIDTKIRARVERQTTRYDMDLSDYIRQAIVEKLERDESTEPNPTLRN